MRWIFPYLSISCSHGTRHGMMSLSKTIWFTNNRTNLISIFTLYTLLLYELLRPPVSFSRIVMPIILTSPTHGSWWVEGRCFENTNAKAGLINLDHFLSSKSFHFDLLVSIQRWPAYHHHDCHSESVRLRCEFKTVWWRQSTRWRSGGREWKCLQLWSFSPKLRPEANVRSLDSFEIFSCHLMCFFPANSNLWKYNWNTTQNSEATRKCWPKWFT